jgi:class 3 adenylate cyclase
VDPVAPPFRPPATGGAPLPAGTQSPGDAEPEEGYAILLFELRRVPRGGSRITPQIEEMVTNRCVLAAIECLSATGEEVRLAGTVLRPVVEARFRGVGSARRAAERAEEIRTAVRRAQRAAENEIQVVGAVAAGTVHQGEDGVTVTTGSAETTAYRLRELAGPGQILLTGSVRAACGEGIDAVRVGALEGRAGEEDDEIHALRGLAEQASS